jgi:hypothetical protein
MRCPADFLSLDGPFAIRVGAGLGPALLSLSMLLTYSVVLGMVYAALNSWVR